MECKVTKDCVSITAEAARLKFSDEEAEAMRRHLQKQADYFTLLWHVDTANALPTAHITSGVSALRADEVAASLPASEILKNAPSSDSKAFVVPKAVE